MKITPFLIQIVPNLNALDNICNVDVVRWDKILMYINRGGIAECERPISDRSFDGFPDADHIRTFIRLSIGSGCKLDRLEMTSDYASPLLFSANLLDYLFDHFRSIVCGMSVRGEDGYSVQFYHRVRMELADRSLREQQRLENLGHVFGPMETQVMFGILTGCTMPGSQRQFDLLTRHS